MTHRSPHYRAFIYYEAVRPPLGFVVAQEDSAAVWCYSLPSRECHVRREFSSGVRAVANETRRSYRRRTPRLLETGNRVYRMDHPVIRYEGADLYRSVRSVDEPPVVDPDLGVSAGGIELYHGIPALAVRDLRPVVCFRRLARYSDAFGNHRRLAGKGLDLCGEPKPDHCQLVHGPPERSHKRGR